MMATIINRVDLVPEASKAIAQTGGDLENIQKLADTVLGIVKNVKSMRDQAIEAQQPKQITNAPPMQVIDAPSPRPMGLPPIDARPAMPQKPKVADKDKIKALLINTLKVDATRMPDHVKDMTLRQFIGENFDTTTITYMGIPLKMDFIVGKLAEEIATKFDQLQKEGQP